MTNVTSQMDQVVNLVNEIASKTDGPGRKNIQDVLMKLQHSLEEPFETTMRMYDWHHRAMVARIGSDLKIFKELSQSPKPLTVDDLAKSSGAAPRLLGTLLGIFFIFLVSVANSFTGRILRYMASEDMIDEVDVDTFTANKTTKWFGTDEMDGAIHLSLVLSSFHFHERGRPLAYNE